jgi:WD40 repeat protein
MARQVAEALAYAHGRGVVHRDIKPANLLLDVQGTIWVTDFGLAKAEGSDELTRPGDVVGTLRYLAPERFRGQADARSDLYSLGMTLYEMLALEPAFRASHRVQLMHAIVHDEPRRPRELNPRIPRDLETIVLKAIAKDPADRFTDAGAMAAELGRFLEGRPIRSRPFSIVERAWRWSRRNPALAALSLAASVLTAMLVVGSVAAARTYRDQRNELTMRQRAIEANYEQAVATERKRRAELGRSHVLRARAERISGRPGRRARALEALTEATQIARDVGAPPRDLADLRDEVIAALALDDAYPERTWSGLEPTEQRAAYDIEGDRCILVGEDGTIHVHRLSDRSEIKAVGNDRPAAREWPVFFPGGRFLHIWSGESDIELWDLERGEVPAAWPADARGVVYRADGRQVAVVRADGELRVYDLPAATESARMQLGFVTRRRVDTDEIALSGDGRRFAFVRAPWRAVQVYDLARGRLVRELPVPPPPVLGGLALDYTGALLALQQARAIMVYDATSGELLARLQGHEASGILSYFQPGGGMLATTAWDGRTRLWDPIRGRPLATLHGGCRGWRGDGSRLTIGGAQELTTYRLAKGVGRRTIDGRTLGGPPSETQYGPARAEFSPDGRLIALPLRPDGVRIVRASDGRGLARLPIGDCDQAVFLPDGGLLTYNSRGVCRWPIRGASAGTLRVGPPEPLALPELPDRFVPAGLAAAARGRLVGASSPFTGGALLLEPDRPSRRIWLAPHRRVWGIAISPDGRWAATGCSATAPASQQVKVWDAADGAPVVQLAVGNARVAFSPDGRWLGVGGAVRYRFYRTGSWAPGAEVEHGVEGGLMPLEFHPGSRVAAITDKFWKAVRLVDVETGGVLAALEPPDPAGIHAMSFSPDGRHLAVPLSDQRVEIWDLAVLRRELGERGLATGIPDLFGGGAGAAAAGDLPAVDRIEVEGADPASLTLLAIRQRLREAWIGFQAMWNPRLEDAEELVARGDRWDRLGHWRLATADYRAALARRPDSFTANHALARLLADAPGRGDPEEAVRRARFAASGQPPRPQDFQTLALALYRAGRFAEAAAALESNIPRNQDSAGLDWLILAMSRRRMGRADAARAALDEATRWRAGRPDLRPDRAAQFERLRREAESVLGAALTDLPADDFAR